MSGREDTRRLALCGVFCALSCGLVYLSGVSEIASLSVLAVAGLITAAAVVECGLGYAALSVAAAGILGLLIAPDKVNVGFYLLMFGTYPLCKSLTERMRSRPAEWVLKLLFCNLSFAAMLAGAALLTLDLGVLASMPRWVWPLVWLAGNGVFLLYDVALSRMIGFYLVRVRPKLGRGR